MHVISHAIGINSVPSIIAPGESSTDLSRSAFDVDDLPFAFLHEPS